MRKKSIVIASLLCVALFFQFIPNDVEGRRSIRHIRLTFCVDQDTEVLTGFSNDCVSGDGACVDHGCPDGTAEKQTFPGGSTED